MLISDDAVLLPLVARYLLAGVLCAGAISKCFNFKWFTRVLSKYNLVPRTVTALVAFAVTCAELLAGILLFWRRFLPGSAYFAIALFFVFTSAVVISLLRGRMDIECGCNGWQKRMKVGWHLMARNMGLVGLGFVVLSVGFASARVQLLSFAVSFVLLLVPLFLKADRPCAKKKQVQAAARSTPEVEHVTPSAV